MYTWVNKNCATITASLLPITGTILHIQSHIYIYNKKILFKSTIKYLYKLSTVTTRVRIQRSHYPTSPICCLRSRNRCPTCQRLRAKHPPGRCRKAYWSPRRNRSSCPTNIRNPSSSDSELFHHISSMFIPFWQAGGNMMIWGLP